MPDAVSLTQKRARLRELERQVQRVPRLDPTRPSGALLLAEVRWERTEIQEIEQALAAVGR